MFDSLSWCKSGSSHIVWKVSLSFSNDAMEWLVSDHRLILKGKLHSPAMTREVNDWTWATAQLRCSSHFSLARRRSRKDCFLAHKRADNIHTADLALVGIRMQTYLALLLSMVACAASGKACLSKSAECADWTVLITTFLHWNQACVTYVSDTFLLISH